MLAPRDSSDPDRRRQMRDAALYGAVVGLVVFLLLLIFIDLAWIVPLLIGVVAGIVAALFFLWSATEGFVRFNEDAARRIAEKTGRGGATAGGSHLGAGDPGGVDPGMPVADDAGERESAAEAAAVFEAEGTRTDGTDRGWAGDHRGAGDPGGVDPGMPVADDPGERESAAEAAEAFEAANRGSTQDSDLGLGPREPLQDGSDEDARSRLLDEHVGAGDPGAVDAGMPDPGATDRAEDAEAAAAAFDAEADEESGLRDAHAGAGDPGSVDPAMPDPDAAVTAESAEEAATAFGSATGTGGTTDQPAAPGRRPELFDAPEGGSGDDLKLIRGVGPKLEAMLHDLGVWHFRQIASWGAEEVAWVDGHLEGFNGRVARDEWVSQARTLAAGGDTAFSEQAREEGDL